MIIYGKDYCVCVCVCVNSTFGRCCHCPCWKEKVEGKKEDVEKTKEEEKIINTENNLILDTPLMDNPGKNELNDTLVGYKYFPNPKDQNESLINEIIEEAIKNSVICDGCKKNKDSESKIKLVFDDHVARDCGNPFLKAVDLEFDFCENHKACIVQACKNDAVFLFQCGHRLCKSHYDEKFTGNTGGIWGCIPCKMCMCCWSPQEGFGIHLLCNKPRGKHYVCFKDKDDENPYKNNDTSYDEKTWLCPEHQDK